MAKNRQKNTFSKKVIGDLWGTSKRDNKTRTSRAYTREGIRSNPCQYEIE